MKIDLTKLPDKTIPHAPSPFLPGTQIQFAWDSTSLGLFKTCPRLYQYTMLDGWGSRDESIHLRFGIEYHTALQSYDVIRATEGVSHETALRIVVKDLLLSTLDFNPTPETKAGKYKNRASLVRTVVNYLDKFADDPAKTYIKADGEPAVELSFRFELDFEPNHTNADGVSPQPYLLCGHLDRVVNYQDSLFVMDHKTTTSTPGDYYFDQYSPNNQMTLYTLASQVVLDSPVKGVIISAAQLLIEDNEYKRGFTYRTQGQLNEWTVDLKYWLNLAEHYATISYWPMNDTACDKFGGCRFRDICTKDPKVRDKFLKSNFDKLEPEERWNPLKPR